MGKMMDALKKAEAYKHDTSKASVSLNSHAAPQVHLEIEQPERIEHIEERTSVMQHAMQATIIIVFLIIGITSIIFNFTTVSELKKTKAQSGQMSVQLHEQGQKLNQLTVMLEQLSAQNKEKENQVAALERSVAQIEDRAIRKDKEAASLASENKALQGNVKALTSQNQAMAENYKDLNTEVQKLKGYIQDLHTMTATPIPAAVGGETKESSEWEN